MTLKAQVAAIIGSLLLAAPAAAQKLKEIGKTSVGTPVFLEANSVKRANGITTATVRVRLQPPLKHALGDLRSSRTIAMYDCAKQTVATKESWYYLDDAGKKVGMHKEVKMPGFGPSFKGSLADVVMRHLCATPPPR
ncbi:surface-adhesin E family protein [Gemmatimonas sp.]|uniref:surface-adhesin E family protein n=1 Tax=Gemmatimonas sp. TaxID=1962908 RepID=UPI00286C9D66|nr:surface-adhesin E family protein [Gemmatimonas sp.]